MGDPLDLEERLASLISDQVGPRLVPELVEELGRYVGGEAYDEQPMLDLDSEALDFRAASESFAPVRRPKRFFESCLTRTGSSRAKSPKRSDSPPAPPAPVSRSWSSVDWSEKSAPARRIPSGATSQHETQAPKQDKAVRSAASAQRCSPTSAVPLFGLGLSLTGTLTLASMHVATGRLALIFPRPPLRFARTKAMEA